MSNENPVPFEEEDLYSLDGFEDDLKADVLVDEGLPVDNLLDSTGKVDTGGKARADARREIERRAELKALNAELDEWGYLDN
jgi:hypothetical protein